MGLVRSLASDQAWASETLAALGAVFPDLLVSALGPQGVTLWGLGVLLVVLALGSFVLTRASGGAFAVLVVATVAWFVFPYARVPWASLLAGGEMRPVPVPTSIWLWGGSLVALATLEVVVSARGRVLETIHAAGLGAKTGPALASWSRSRTFWVLAASLAVGSGFSVGYALLGESQWFQWPVPDLLWVPVALGVVLAVTLWVANERAPL